MVFEMFSKSPRTIISASHCWTKVNQQRCLAQLSTNVVENKFEDKMQAWQIHSYGNLDELKCSNARMPVITSPNDVLVKIQASSVNPIDVAMISK